MICDLYLWDAWILNHLLIFNPNRAPFRAKVTPSSFNSGTVAERNQSNLSSLFRRCGRVATSTVEDPMASAGESDAGKDADAVQRNHFLSEEVKVKNVSLLHSSRHSFHSSWKLTFDWLLGSTKSSCILKPALFASSNPMLRNTKCLQFIHLRLQCPAWYELEFLREFRVHVDHTVFWVGYSTYRVTSTDR